jgi:hypothetical protein
VRREPRLRSTHLTSEVTVLKKEPAVLIGVAAAVIAAGMQAINAGSVGEAFDLWAAVLVGLPLLVGVLTRFNVVASETVRDILDRAGSGLEAARELNKRVKAQNPPDV